MTIHSIRLILLKVAGKLVQTGRQVYLKLSSYHVYQTEFYKVFERLRHPNNGFRLVITQIFNRFFFKGIRLPLNRQIIFIMIFFRRHPVRKHIIFEESICLI